MVTIIASFQSYDQDSGLPQMQFDETYPGEYGLGLLEEQRGRFRSGSYTNEKFTDSSKLLLTYNFLALHLVHF